MLYDWPGNIRELENIIEYAVVMTDADILTDDLILQNDTGEDSFLNFQEARTRFEKNYLLNLLKATGGNVSKAAEFAGKYRADLYNLLKKHNISPADFKN